MGTSIFFPYPTRNWIYHFLSTSKFFYFFLVETSTHQHTSHQHINTVMNTSTHQHINTSTHQHISTSTHQHINHQHINTSTQQHISTSTHQHINTSHQHINTSTHQHIKNRHRIWTPLAKAVRFHYFLSIFVSSNPPNGRGAGFRRRHFPPRTHPWGWVGDMKFFSFESGSKIMSDKRKPKVRLHLPKWNIHFFFLSRCVDVLMCWCLDVLMCSCVHVLMCWCVDVLMCWCVDVLMCCVDVLMTSLMCWWLCWWHCADVYMCWLGVDMLMCCCVDVLMCWCDDV